MNLKELSINLSHDIENLGYHLYDLKYNKSENILSVMIDESIDLNQIEVLSKKVSKIMDKYDADFSNYILDVCSAGVERPIKTLDEVKQCIGEYIYIKTDSRVINGTLKKIKDDILTIEYLDKNIKKLMDIKYQKIKKIRKAVKI